MNEMLKRLEKMCSKEDRFEMDSRVGHGSTSVLQNEVKNYIIANTIDCKYVGEPKYLQIYAEISNYNLTTKDEEWFRNRIIADIHTLPNYISNDTSINLTLPHRI